MSSPTHVPVLLDRVVALVAPALERPGSVFVDATLGLGGHSEAVLDRCPEARVVGRRPRPARPRARRCAARPLRGPHHPGARGVRRDPRRARRARHRLGRRHPLRPRRLLDAARPARARFRLRRGRAARHADGRQRGPDRGRRAEQLPGRRAGPDPAQLRRGEVRPADRAGDRRASGRPSRSPGRPGWSSCSGRRSRHRHGVREDTRPSAPSRPCASRSTTSSASSAEPSRRPSRPSASGAASW